jgi:hypothetical protein
VRARTGFFVLYSVFKERVRWAWEPARGVDPMLTALQCLANLVSYQRFEAAL